MPDLLIVRNRGVAVVIADTDEGRKWLIENVDLKDQLSVKVHINLDTLKEFIEHVEAEGLNVEVR